MILLALALAAPALAQPPAPGAPASFPVTVRVDARAEVGEMRPIWRFFGYDEPNLTYTKDGERLLGELAKLGPHPVFIRTHHLLTRERRRARLHRVPCEGGAEGRERPRAHGRPAGRLGPREPRRPPPLGAALALPRRRRGRSGRRRRALTRRAARGRRARARPALPNRPGARQRVRALEGDGLAPGARPAACRPRRPGRSRSANPLSSSTRTRTSSRRTIAALGRIRARRQATARSSP
jgi:hypothetical protein